MQRNNEVAFDEALVTTWTDEDKQVEKSVLLVKDVQVLILKFPKTALEASTWIEKDEMIALRVLELDIKMKLGAQVVNYVLKIHILHKVLDWSARSVRMESIRQLWVERQKNSVTRVNVCLRMD